MRAQLLVWLMVLPALAAGAPEQARPAAPPYPPSPVITGMNWDWTTLRTGAPGSDLWPVTWTQDDAIFTAWGDGGGFGGTNLDGRVALGFGRIDAKPEHLIGTNINGGKNPRHPASFPKLGKTGGILAIGNRIFAWLNTQNGRWPDVDQALIWSDDGGATWQQAPWVFGRGDGKLKPSTFLNFGRGHCDVPEDLAPYAYFYAQKQGQPNAFYLGRSLPNKLPEQASYEFVSALDAGHAGWSSDLAKACPVFVDTRPNGDLASVVYLPALRRYLLTSFHKGPGQLGIFDGPHPWGPWTTVAYYEDWGRMGSAGEGLTCSFPAKWFSEDGRILWAIFSAYGAGAKEGINAHDKLNLVRVTLELRR